MGEERTTALAGLCGVMNLMLLLSCGGVGCEVEVQVWPPRVEGFTEALVTASAVRNFCRFGELLLRLKTCFLDIGEESVIVSTACAYIGYAFIVREPLSLKPTFVEVYRNVNGLGAKTSTHLIPRSHIFNQSRGVCVLLPSLRSFQIC